MAVSERGGIAEIEGWTQPVRKSFPQRFFSGLANFARKKPLGAVCGTIVIFFMIVGDLVPETINKITAVAGVQSTNPPLIGRDLKVPYVADLLEKNTGFIYPYAKQDLRARLQDPSSKHLLGIAGLCAGVKWLEARGIDTSSLKVSASAHVIADYNRTLDKVAERFLGSRRIGTTGRGIGPTYADKMNRIGIRIQDLFDEKILTQKVEGSLELKNQILTKIYNRRAVTVEQTVDALLEYADRIAPMVCDTGLLLSQALDRDETVLLEAGQATLLDVDHGTYPFVTSSNCVAGNAAAGSGVGPQMLHHVLGITKAYTTRVGGGPFPTELPIDQPGTVGHHLSTVGQERGVVTGRARRCGWLDAAALRRAMLINGVSGLCITKLDVLDGLDTIRICVGYRDRDGNELEMAPLGADSLAEVETRYEEMPGWQESTLGITAYDGRPANAKAYLERLQDLCGVPIDLISTGADRTHTIVLRHPFD